MKSTSSAATAASAASAGTTGRRRLTAYQYAIETLRTVALIAAEDTRHSRPLLLHHGIATPLVALHDHNEREVVDALVARLQGGEHVIVVAGRGEEADARLAEGQRVFAILREELPPARAAKLAAAISGAPRKALYES